MMEAAGIILCAPSGRVLLLKRNGGSDHAGEWCFPGGGIEDGEDAQAAAVREMKEETGYDMAGDLTQVMSRDDGAVRYTTFFGQCDEEFVPQLNDEHSAFAWVNPSEAIAEFKIGQDAAKDTVTPVPAAALVAAPETSPAIADADWNEGDHPRGQPGNAGQFASSPGGGGGAAEKTEGGKEPAATEKAASAPETGGKAPAKSEPASKSEGDRKGLGHTFVSPNVSINSKFKAAEIDFHSKKQKALAKVSRLIDHEVGLRIHTDHEAVGTWDDGAEESIVTIAKDATMEQLKLAAAMKGYLANQKSVLVFHENPQGNSTICSFDMEGDVEEINKNLVELGLPNHTIIPLKKNRGKVYLVDVDGDTADKIMKGIGKYGGENLECRVGDAEYIGTSGGEEGSDADDRRKAKEAYAGIIKGSGVQDAEGIWNRIHSAYGDSIEDPLTKLGVKINEKVAKGTSRFVRKNLPDILKAAAVAAPAMAGEHIIGMAYHSLDDKVVQKVIEGVVTLGAAALGFEENSLAGAAIGVVGAYALSETFERLGWNKEFLLDKMKQVGNAAKGFVGRRFNKNVKADADDDYSEAMLKGIERIIEGIEQADEKDRMSFDLTDAISSKFQKLCGEPNLDKTDEKVQKIADSVSDMVRSSSTIRWSFRDASSSGGSNSTKAARR